MLPVFWRANRKAWVMAAIVMNWFPNCFIPQVERYLAEQNLVFKLLLVYNTPSQFGDLKVAHLNVEVIFLLPNATSLIQPLDQGIIATFKMYYTRRTFCCILDAMDPMLTIGQCLKEFNTAHCIGAIKESSLDEVKTSTINACWHNLWPQAVKNFRGFPDNIEEA